MSVANRRHFVVAACYWCFLGVSAVLAEGSDAAQPAIGPSSADPDALLPPGTLEFSHPAYQRASEKYHAAAERVKSLVDRDASGKLRESKGMLLEIGQAHTLVVQAQRLATELLIFREPAAVDLEQRAKELREPLVELRRSVLSDPKVAEQVKKSEAKWLKDAEQLQNRLPEAEKLVVKQKWREAVEVYYELLDALEPRGFWYDAPVRPGGLAPFVGALAGAEPRHHQQLQEQTDAALEKPLNEALFQVEAAASEAEALLESLSKGPEGRIGERQLAGPELVAALGVRWRRCCFDAQRARAICWRWGVGRKQETPQLGQLERGYAKFTAAAIQSFARAIIADATSVPEGDLQARNQRYLEELAPLVNLDVSDVLASTVEPALEALVARSAEFATGVSAYRRATSDLLRWRERTAAAYAARRAREYVSLSSLVVDKFHLASGGAPGRPGERDQPLTWTIDQPAPKMVRDVLDQLLHHQVWVSDVQAGPDAAACGGYARRCYARLPGRADLTGLAAELRSCLFASDAAGALTLEAAAAIDDAQRGSCVGPGGTIESFELEALLTRFADMDAGLVRLGPMPPEKKLEHALRECLLAVEVRPAWWQHRYGFVEIKR